MDERRLRDIAGSFATGVTVVTSQAHDGHPIGMTVNSFTSLSLDPPMVLVTIAKRASLYADFLSAESFAVNVLSAAQEGISRTFAAKEIDRFAHIDYRQEATGAPVLDGVLGYFDCKVAERYEGGDHIILVGEVIDGDVCEGQPLVFFKGQYASLEGQPAPTSRS
jgi:flavin reductase (DIM6/NTAB) family NADH-FMN oxidoreductase RutF